MIFLDVPSSFFLYKIYLKQVYNGCLSINFNNLFVRVINMNTKNMSFSQLLKKKGRSSQVEVPRGRAKLSEIVEQWLEFPAADYTLYLDSMGLSQKTPSSSVCMFTSRNTNKAQSQMFDSWILKQSSISNKENINIMPKKCKVKDSTLKANLPVKKSINYEQKQIIKTKPKVILNNGRFSEIKNIQQSNKSMKYQSQVKMDDSHGSDTGFKSVGFKNYNLVRENDRNLAIQFQQIDEKPLVNPHQMPKCEQKNIFLNCHETQIEEAKSITYSNEGKEQYSPKKQIAMKEGQKLNHYLSQMDDIMNKYNNLSQSQQSVEELIIQNKTENCQYKQPLFSEDYAAKMQKQQQIKKIRQNYARSQLKLIIQDISNSSKIVNHHLPTFNHNFKKHESEVSPIQEAVSNLTKPQISVGYSFANNFLRDRQEEKVTNKYLTIQNIEQVQSERSPFDKSNQIKDYYERQFKNIAYKCTDLSDSHQDIQNIQSVGFEPQVRQDESKLQVNNLDNSGYGPQDSFQYKYINAQKTEDIHSKIINNSLDQSQSQQQIYKFQKMSAQKQNKIEELQKMSYGLNSYTQDDQITESPTYDFRNNYEKYQDYNLQKEENPSINQSWKGYLNTNKIQALQSLSDKANIGKESFLIQNDCFPANETAEIARSVEQQQILNKQYNTSGQLEQKQVKQSISSHVSEECLITPQKQVDFNNYNNQNQVRFDYSEQKNQQQEDTQPRPETLVVEQRGIQSQDYIISYPIQIVSSVLQSIQISNQYTIPPRISAIESNLTLQQPSSNFETLNLSAQIDNTILPHQPLQEPVKTMITLSRQENKVGSDEMNQNVMNSPLYDIIVQKQQEHIVSILKLEEEQAKGKKNKSVTFIEPVSIISKPEEIKDESDEEDFAFDL